VLLIAGGDYPKLFQSLKGILDMVAFLVVPFVYLLSACSIPFRWNTELHIPLFQKLDQSVAVISFVSKDRDPLWDIVA
jgi:hypothetical protein